MPYMSMYLAASCSCTMQSTRPLLVMIALVCLYVNEPPGVNNVVCIIMLLVVCIDQVY
jgi:hypothetical protein